MTKLKQALLEAGIPQYQIARRAGLNETRLSRLANGRAEPTNEEGKALAATLGVSQKKLFPKLAEVQ